MSAPDSSLQRLAVGLSGVAIAGGLATVALTWRNAVPLTVVHVGIFLVSVLLPVVAGWGAWRGDHRPASVAGGLLVVLGLVLITSFGLLLVPLGLLVAGIAGLLYLDARRGSAGPAAS